MKTLKYIMKRILQSVGLLALLTICALPFVALAASLKYGFGTSIAMAALAVPLWAASVASLGPAFFDLLYGAIVVSGIWVALDIIGFLLA